MNPFELRYHRLNTTAFIATNPSALILVPQIRERTASAGYRVSDGEPRSEQIFRIIELGASYTPPILRLVDGQQREQEFWLLGEHDAAIEIGDHWIAMDGRDWEIGDIVRSNGYEQRALVAERGK